MSSALCHLGNISYRLGESVLVSEAPQRLGKDDELQETFARFAKHLQDNGLKPDKTRIALGRRLRVDPAAETIPGNQQAQAMLTREYRKPFVVPEQGAL